jgi:hypothetical protein
MLHNAQAACSDVGKIGDVTQMGDADAVFNSSVENASSLDGVKDGPVYTYVDILQHANTSFSQATRIASNLHSLRHIPHF